MPLILYSQEKNDAYGLMTFEKDLNIETAMEGTRLIKISDQIGEKKLVTAISFYLIRLNEHFNVGKKFTPLQSVTIAFDIIERYPHETMEDIVLMLKWVRQGVIGDGKDFKIDSQTVFHKWFPEYLEKKAEQREKALKVEQKKINEIPVWDAENVSKFEVGTTDGPTMEGLGSRLKRKFNQ
jgi:hypothetical protein